MGFWSSVGSFVSSTVSTVWNVVKPIGTAIIGGVVKKIAEWIGLTDELKKAPKYDERNASMDETFKISELLEKQRKGFSNSILTLENEILNSAKSRLKKLIELSEELNKNFDTSINVQYLKKQLNNFLNSIKNSLSEKVNQKIQISDPECSQLLKLEGNEREIQIDKYIKKIIDFGMENSMHELKEKTNEIIELVEFSIQEKLNQKNKEINLLIKDIENFQLQESLEEKNKKKKELLRKEREIDQYLTLLGKISLVNEE